MSHTTVMKNLSEKSMIRNTNIRVGDFKTNWPSFPHYSLICIYISPNGIS